MATYAGFDGILETPLDRFVEFGTLLFEIENFLLVFDQIDSLHSLNLELPSLIEFPHVCHERQLGHRYNDLLFLDFFFLDCVHHTFLLTPTVKNGFLVNVFDVPMTLGPVQRSVQ